MAVNVLIAKHLNNPMEQSPSWEANSSSASKEIPSILWNPKVDYSAHKSQYVQSTPSSYSWNTQFNIIFQSTPESFKVFPYIRFPRQNSVDTPPVPYTYHKLRPSYSSWFDQPNNISLGVQIIKLLIT